MATSRAIFRKSTWRIVPRIGCRSSARARVKWVSEPTRRSMRTLAPASVLSVWSSSRASTVTATASMPRPYTVPGTFPDARIRRAGPLPLLSLTSALSATSATGYPSWRDGAAFYRLGRALVSGWLLRQRDRAHRLVGSYVVLRAGPEPLRRVLNLLRGLGARLGGRLRLRDLTEHLHDLVVAVAAGFRSHQVPEGETDQQPELHAHAM